MGNLSDQQFKGKHEAKTEKPARYSSIQGHEYGTVNVAASRNQGPVHVGYIGKHSTSQFRRDLEPDAGHSKEQIQAIHGNK